VKASTLKFIKYNIRIGRVTVYHLFSDEGVLLNSATKVINALVENVTFSVSLQTSLDISQYFFFGHSN
jgi:hypothetical protein